MLVKYSLPFILLSKNVNPSVLTVLWFSMVNPSFSRCCICNVISCVLCQILCKLSNIEHCPISLDQTMEAGANVNRSRLLPSGRLFISGEWDSILVYLSITPHSYHTVLSTFKLKASLFVLRVSIYFHPPIADRPAQARMSSA